MFTKFVKVLFLLCFIALSATVKAQQIHGFPIVQTAPESILLDDGPALYPDENDFLPIEEAILPIEEAFLPIEEAFLPVEEVFLPSEEDILVQR